MGDNTPSMWDGGFRIAAGIAVAFSLYAISVRILAAVPATHDPLFALLRAMAPMTADILPLARLASLPDSDMAVLRDHIHFMRAVTTLSAFVWGVAFGRKNLRAMTAYLAARPDGRAWLSATHGTYINRAIVVLLFALFADYILHCADFAVASHAPGRITGASIYGIGWGTYIFILPFITFLLAPLNMFAGTVTSVFFGKPELPSAPDLRAG